MATILADIYGTSQRQTHAISRSRLRRTPNQNQRRNSLQEHGPFGHEVALLNGNRQPARKPLLGTPKNHGSMRIPHSCPQEQDNGWFVGSWRLCGPLGPFFLATNSHAFTTSVPPQSRLQEARLDGCYGTTEPLAADPLFGGEAAHQKAFSTAEFGCPELSKARRAPSI